MDYNIYQSRDWMDSSYYSPQNKTDLLDKQQRDEEHNKRFPKEENN